MIEYPAELTALNASLHKLSEKKDQTFAESLRVTEIPGLIMTEAAVLNAAKRAAARRSLVLEHPAELDALGNNLDKLAEKDRKFAESLLEHHANYAKLSPKQWHWVGVLLDKAGVVVDEPAAIPVPLGRLKDMLTHAKLKFPAICLYTPMGDIRLSISGPKSRYPGTVNVTTAERSAKTSEGYRREYLGWIAEDGQFMASRALAEDNRREDRIRAALSAFAQDPAGVARQYGKRTGNCCFCSQPLTNGASLTVGYGPVCAKQYGLPWG